MSIVELENTPISLQSGSNETRDIRLDAGTTLYSVSVTNSEKPSDPNSKTGAIFVDISLRDTTGRFIKSLDNGFTSSFSFADKRQHYRPVEWEGIIKIPRHGNDLLLRVYMENESGIAGLLMINLNTERMS